MKKILYVLILIFSVGCTKEEVCVDIDIERDSTTTATHNGILVVDCSNATVKLTIDGQETKRGASFSYPVREGQVFTINYYRSSNGFASNYDVRFVCNN